MLVVVSRVRLMPTEKRFPVHAGLRLVLKIPKYAWVVVFVPVVGVAGALRAAAPETM